MADGWTTSGHRFSDTGINCLLASLQSRSSVKTASDTRRYYSRAVRMAVSGTRLLGSNSGSSPLPWLN